MGQTGSRYYFRGFALISELFSIQLFSPGYISCSFCIWFWFLVLMILWMYNLSDAEHYKFHITGWWIYLNSFQERFLLFSARQALITVWSFWGFRMVLETFSRANLTLFCGTIFLQSNKILALLAQVWPCCSGLQACVCTARLSWQVSRLLPWIPLYSRAPPSSSCFLSVQLEPASSDHCLLPANAPACMAIFLSHSPLLRACDFSQLCPLSPPVLW